MARTEFLNEALPSAGFVTRVGAIREGAILQMAEEPSDKARISLIHRHRRLTATLSLAAVLGMMAVPIVPGDAYGAKLEVGQGQTSAVSGTSSDGAVVSGGGVINVNSGGKLIGSGGPAASGILVGPNGTININSGGSAVGSAWGNTSTPPDLLASGAGAKINVNSSGYAEKVAGVGGAVINVNTGGAVKEGSVASGGVANVYDGAVVSQFGVQNGGELNLFEGGTYSSGGGVNTGGIMNILGGSADELSINGGTVVMKSGAVTTAEVMSGGSWVVSGGTVDGAAVKTDGVMDVYGGSVSNYHVGFSSGGSSASGGEMNVSGGSAISGAIASGGVMNVHGGLVSAGLIQSEGEMNVAGGEVQAYTVGSSGMMNVTDGELSGITVDEGGTQKISGGNMTNYVVSSGGSANVYGGEVVSGLVVGEQNVSGGVVSVVTISGGGVQTVYGGTVAGFNIESSGTVNVSGGELSGGQVSGSDAVLNIAGGTVSTVGILSGGSASVAAGATLADMKLFDGGSATFADGAYLAGADNVLNQTGALAGMVTMKDAATKLHLDATKSDLTASATFKGNGTISVNGASSANDGVKNVTMTGANSGFNGVFEVQEWSRLTAGADFGLGSGAVVKVAETASAVYGAHSAVVRGLEGAGEQIASALTIEQQDADTSHVMDGKLTTVSAGDLIIKGGTAGTGAQILNNSDNQVSGAVNLSAGGVLIVGDSADNSGAILEASAASGFTASGAGALIGGFGLLKGSAVTIQNGAALAPGYGSSFGSLTISGGPLEITNGGVFQAKLGANSSGGLLYDKVTVDNEDATMNNASIKFITSDDAQGLAAAIVENNGELTLNVNDLINDQDDTVELTGTNSYSFDNPMLASGTLTSAGDISTRVADISDIGLDLGLTDNRSSVYNGLQGSKAMLGEMFTVAEAALKNDAPQLMARALDSLTGEIYGAAVAQAQGLQIAAGRQMLGRLAGFYNYGDAPAAGSYDGQNNLWLGIGGSRGKIDGDRKIGTAEADTKRVETAMGYHRAFENGWGLGAALQFSWGQVDVDERWSESDVDSVGFTLYGTKAVPTGAGDMRFTFGGNYSHYTVDSERWAQLARPQKLTGHLSGNGYGLFAEAAHRFQLSEGVESRAFVEPFLGLRYDSLNLDTMRESGGIAALEIDADNMNNFSTDLGFRLIGDINETVSLNGSLSWSHTFGDTETWTRSSFVDGGSAFKIQGNSASGDDLNIGLGATFRVGEGLGLSVGYDGVIGDNSQSHGGKAVLDFRF